MAETRTAILGLSAYYHDSAAALVVDGRIVAAAQEERFTRKKHDAGFPVHAVRACLELGGLELHEVDHVVFYEKPFVKFERLLETYLSFAPRGVRSFWAAMPVWLKEKLFQRKLLTDELRALDARWDPQREHALLFTEHHQSHAASAFFPSPFAEAIVLTLDGVGEWTTTSAGVGRGNRLELDQELVFPHSLGLLYSAFTYYTGFKVNSGEYKVMGLAPYGEPRYADLIREHLIDIKDDGSFALDMRYFDYCTGLTMTNRRFDRLFGGPPRRPESQITQREMDLARSVQEVTEEVMLKMTQSLVARTGLKRMCLAGGVALNCVANGRILRETDVEQLWIQPAAGDAGGALGAALATWFQFLDRPRTADGATDAMVGSYLGPRFATDEVAAYLDEHGYPYERLDDESLWPRLAAELDGGKVLGWFQGRMEFGPRALGGRSILGDPRSPQMQSTMNLKIKYRESFRPFAPAVLAEEVGRWFDFEGASPYMLLVDRVRQEHRRAMSDEEQQLFGIAKLNVPRSSIPAVTHVDYSARLQTVHRETNPRFHALISAFFARTGCPVVVNTSFNVRGEPIVATPEDAYRCFMRTEMDVLVLENCVLTKNAQPAWQEHGDWQQEFELD